MTERVDIQASQGIRYTKVLIMVPIHIPISIPILISLSISYIYQ